MFTRGGYQIAAVGIAMLLLLCTAAMSLSLRPVGDDAPTSRPDDQATSRPDSPRPSPSTRPDARLRPTSRPDAKVAPAPRPPVAPRRVRVYISGKVQGVGFRDWTRKVALQLGLTGWVRNLSDGRVEAVIEGRPDRVSEMITLLHRGPRRARVERVQSADEPHQGQFKTFTVER